jgi:hypothetical protein
MSPTIALKACDKWDFQLHAVAPTLENGWTLLGEPSKWVPVSRGEGEGRCCHLLLTPFSLI